ncbi:DUF1345 domain-containing protein [Microlunatus parietis]|uniref:DUF1345 domain-containing protein n=1 Tax=Microlunatus parietis TaxID=682979 RepID=A0A7Y9LAD8_9ACTN|nr:DUF1345 domain-containing protein [Microlunatus parietis]NYE72734.1 hypothetical protein [Microlunatus parietis]
MPRLRSEWARIGLALLVAGVGVTAAFLIGAMAGVRQGTFTVEQVTGPAGVAVLYLAFWIGYSVIYLATTLVTFGRADGATLALWFRESPEGRERRRVLELLLLASGPAGSVSLCIASLVAVVVFAMSEELHGNLPVVGLTFGVVLCSWLVIAITYAEHYARENSNDRQLVFPGEERDGPPEFSDYIYLAVQVGTTFATSDVAIERRSMRRTVTVHSVVTFAYNTVVVALIVSLFLGAAG